MRTLADKIKAQAHELGFDLVGITNAEPSVFQEEYRRWAERGFAGEMHYLTRDMERRFDPRALLPDARSMVVVGMNYYAEEGQGTPCDDAARGIFARYARGDDYHDVMGERLKSLLHFIQKETDERTNGRVYVDTGPILEREAARRAGLGWFGKNTMLINTRRGSYFFLGEILLNIELDADTPAVGGCGSCRKCLDACPTNAIIAPFEIDARRCLSYLTIEQKGAIPDEFAPALSASGPRIYGCDICQEVCPFNRPASSAPHPTLSATTEAAYQPREITANKSLIDLLLLSPEEFRTAFKGSAVKRAKRRGLLRNAAAALGAHDDPEAVAALTHALDDPEPLVREQATASLRRIAERKTTGPFP